MDLRIIDLLRRDGRMSFTDLAKATGMSTSATHQRVRRLEERGVITGYHAEVDPILGGLPMTALIALTPIDPADPDNIPEKIRHIEVIESCWSVAGSDHYIVLVRVPTPAALEELIAQLRKEGHCTTRTTVVLSTPWERRTVPVYVPPGEDLD